MKSLLNIEKDLALVLTASIDIKGMPKATPSIPEQREEDYFNSLKYYVTNHPKIRRLVFVENSGWPLEKLKKTIEYNPYNKEVEFVSLNCNDFPRKFGKGYGEALLIKQGIEKSNLLQSITHIAKITGRIRLFNMTEILEKVNESYDLLCDIKDLGWIYKKYVLQEKTASAHCDTRFLVFSIEFYHKYLKDLVEKHEQGTFTIEKKFYDAITGVPSTEKLVLRLPSEPDFHGIAGHFQGKNYESPQERMKWKIRSLSRKVAPWLHL